jgi:hypothetical protein
MGGIILMTLLDECIEALSNDTQVLSEEETQRIFDTFENTFPFTSWGRIDWDRLDKKIYLDSEKDILLSLNERFSQKRLESSIYILWDEGSLPAVKATLKNSLKVIDDVTSVSFDTWIFCPNLGYVIEFYHEGEITIGIIAE